MLAVARLANSGNRLTLKGGMAMRALHGSVRLTKDIDYDCSPEFPVQTLKKQVGSALKQAGISAGLTSIKVDCTMEEGATCRWRLAGMPLGGTKQVRWDVEVSRRGPPQSEFLVSPTFVAPREGTMKILDRAIVPSP